MEANFQALSVVLKKYSGIFTELVFDMLYPLPGSHSFDYLRTPGAARNVANRLGLNVNDSYLEQMYPKYASSDVPDQNELIRDFMKACCPDITMEIGLTYVKKTEQLLEHYKIATELGYHPIQRSPQVLDIVLPISK